MANSKGSKVKLITVILSSSVFDIQTHNNM